MVTLYVRMFRLYPSSFRTRFGEEMLQFVREEAAHGRRVYWTRTLVDLFRSALTERWKDNNMRPKLAIGLAVVLVTFLVARVVIGSGFTPETAIVIGVQLAIVGALFGLGALVGRRVRGAEYDYAVRRFRWWWVPAGLLGGAEVVMSIGQLIREPKGTNVFAMFLLCGFAALVFSGMRLRNRRAGNYMIAVGVLPATALFWLIVPTLLAITVIVNALADNFRIAHPRPAAV
jgi:hypothetical protein